MKKIVLSLIALCGHIYGEVGVFADVLFWCAKESGSDNWAQVFSGDNIDIRQVDFGLDYGFRIGFDIDTHHDMWDTTFYYTWFRAQGDDRASTTGKIDSSFGANFYIDNEDGTEVGPSYRKASIKWTILYNMFDWELGRPFNVSDHFSLRPFLGLRGGWIRQSIDSRWKNPTSGNFVSAKEDLDNNFYGVGPSTGLNFLWNLGPVSLFGDFSGALLAGRFSFDDVYLNNTNEKVFIDLSSFHSAATTFRAFMGVLWEVSFFHLRVGYEAQFWPSMLQFYSLNTGRMNNILTLQGGTLEVRFTF